MIPIEISAELFELGEVLHCFHGSLAAEQALDIQPAQRRGIQAPPVLLGPRDRIEVRGAIGMTVGMAIKAGNPLFRIIDTAIAGQVELLLCERREQQAQTIQLPWRQNPIEEIEV